MTGKQEDQFIPLELYCNTTRVEMQFMETLADSGLLQITYRGEERVIPMEDLAQVERLVRLHDDLGINVEGIEAIEHLLGRMQALQQEVNELRNRLRRFSGME